MISIKTSLFLLLTCIFVAIIITLAIVLSPNYKKLAENERCNNYKDCEQCLGAKDVDCGWCFLENKCSLNRNCEDAAIGHELWVPYKTGKCKTATIVTQDQIQSTDTVNLALNIKNLPSVEGSLVCVFSMKGKNLTSVAKVTATGVSCDTPKNDLLPLIGDDEHTLDTVLSLRKKNGPDFASTKLVFFDCGTYRLCTECVSSEFSCEWCVGNQRCTHNATDYCKNDVLVTGDFKLGSRHRSGKTFCPKITYLDKQEIVISSGTNKSIQVQVENLVPESIKAKNFECKFKMEDREIIVNAQINNKIVTCDATEFTYNSKEESVNAAFEIIWGNFLPLYNPDNVHVLMYQCKQMANRCDTCINMPNQFKCGWCHMSNRCEVREQCSTEESSLNWLETCNKNYEIPNRN